MSTTSPIPTSTPNGGSDMINHGANASAPSPRNSQDKAYAENLAGQHLWATEMAAFTRPTPRDAAVLLLSWEVDEQFSMHTTRELTDLDQVFTSRYNFTVHTKLLRTYQPQAPRYQLASILNDFLTEHDKPGSDLIIYYGGHGMSSDDGEELRLSAGDYDDTNRDSTELIWNDVEPMLYRIRANLVLIFDCCNAGLVARAKRAWPEATSHFEFIASTAHDKTARGPKSRGSFTRAMIGALHELATKDGFTREELLRKVLDSKVFRRTSQAPVAGVCGKKNRYRDFRITPREKSTQQGLILSSQEEETVNFYLHLKYVFKEKPSEAHYKALAERLDDLVKNDRLPIENVLWEGLSQYNPRMSMQDAARMLSARLGRQCRRRSAGRLEISATNQQPATLQRTLTMLTTDKRADEDPMVPCDDKGTRPDRRFYHQVTTLPIFFRPTPLHAMGRTSICLTILVVSAVITLLLLSLPPWFWPVGRAS